MLGAGEDAGEGPGGSMDFIGLAYHGQTITHLDASCHAFWSGKMYNNRDARLVTARNKAKAGHIELLRNGLAGRGVLLDIARSRGVDYMEPGQGVMPDDVERAQEQQGVEVREGDILFLRTGNYKRRMKVGHQGDGIAGPHAALLPWLHRTGVAVLSSDSPNDVFPREYPKVGLALHSIGIVALGLWLLDNANLEDLTQACQQEGRWEFLMTVNPLRIPGGTGSPVNPIAVF
jgi:kynurenine formamidase